MTTIWVTKGEQIYVGGVITETTGKDITGATFLIALGDSKTPPDSGGTPDVDEAVTDSSRNVLLLVDDGYEAGGPFYAWARVADTPEIDWVRFNDPITIA